MDAWEGMKEGRVVDQNGQLPSHLNVNMAQNDGSASDSIFFFFCLFLVL
jgi:hypothetical protein